jgi:putative ABC transport system permease protein
MNFFTELREGLAISWSAILANKLRSVLTTLGIVIGIVTVTLMAAAIEGLNRAFLNNISSIGADVLYVDRRGWLIRSHQEWIEAMKNPVVTLNEAKSVEAQMTRALAVAPVAQDDGPVSYRKKSSSTVPIIGTTDKYLLTAGLTIAEGRFLSAAESMGGRPVCVIGWQVATNLFGAESPVGKSISANHHDFQVVGVLEKQGGLNESGGADNVILMPLPQFLRAVWSNPPYIIQVKVGSPDEVAEAREELRAAMRRLRHLAPGAPDNFAINQQEQFLEMFHKIAGTIEAVGLFITGLSLFVGGIGIMNIMFVSVAERTREIGVRKAIGAKRRAIMVQFLAEAACICLLGGAIGLMIAWPATLLLQKAMPASLSPLIVGLALVISALTGVLSGFFPAWRAAHMNPVDALRDE